MKKHHSSEDIHSWSEVTPARWWQSTTPNRIGLTDPPTTFRMYARSVGPHTRLKALQSQKKKGLQLRK